MMKYLAHGGFERQSRILPEDILPLPPVYSTREDEPVPLFALVLPFTIYDTFQFATKWGLSIRRGSEPHADDKYSTTGLQELIIQTLPLPYCRWAWIYDNQFRCLVLATNYTKKELEHAFDIDMLERIRLFLGVSWYPIWALTTGVKTPYYADWPKIPLPRLPASVEPVPRLRWEDLRPILPCSWRDLLRVERLRRKGRRNFLGTPTGPIPLKRKPKEEENEEEV